MVFLFVVVAAVVVVAIWVTTMSRHDTRRGERLPPPLLYPVAPRSRGAMPRPAHPAHARRADAEPSRKVAAMERPRPVPVTRVADVERPIVTEEEPDVASTVHFRRPTEEAVQLLPGRLEVLAGEKKHKEIRLVRVPGERPEVILGRERVDAPGHVALQSSTVSRRHARLEYADGVWKVANLSQTNPVVVNDEAVPANHERTLSDGDRLELGEVVFRFHAG